MRVHFGLLSVTPEPAELVVSGASATCTWELLTGEHPATLTSTPSMVAAVCACLVVAGNFLMPYDFELLVSLQ